MGLDLSTTFVKGRKLRFNSLSNLVCSVVTAVYSSYRTRVTVRFDDLSKTVPSSVTVLERSVVPPSQQALQDVLQYGQIQSLGEVAGALSLNFGTSTSISFKPTGSTVLTFTSKLVSSLQQVFLFISNGGERITWPSNFSWSGGSYLALRTVGTDIVELVTMDGGINWIGTVWSSQPAFSFATEQDYTNSDSSYPINSALIKPKIVALENTTLALSQEVIRIAEKVDG